MWGRTGSMGIQFHLSLCSGRSGSQEIVLGNGHGKRKLFHPHSYVYCLSFLSFTLLLVEITCCCCSKGMCMLCRSVLGQHTEELFIYCPAVYTLPSLFSLTHDSLFIGYRFPESKGEQWPALFPSCTARAEIKLVDGLIRYNPSHRLTAAQVNNFYFYR